MASSVGATPKFYGRLTLAPWLTPSHVYRSASARITIDPVRSVHQDESVNHASMHARRRASRFRRVVGSSCSILVAHWPWRNNFFYMNG